MSFLLNICLGRTRPRRRRRRWRRQCESAGLHWIRLLPFPAPFLPCFGLSCLRGPFSLPYSLSHPTKGTFWPLLVLKVPTRLLFFRPVKNCPVWLRELASFFFYHHLSFGYPRVCRACGARQLKSDVGTNKSIHGGCLSSRTAGPSCPRCCRWPPLTLVSPFAVCAAILILHSFSALVRAKLPQGSDQKTDGGADPVPHPGADPVPHPGADPV
ncbi:unnamed protein product, partial [Phaeothamnion confervicola]